MKNIDEQIKLKEKELSELRKLKEQEDIKPFLHLVGKYYRLASTCFVRVDSIEYVDNYHIHINGLIVYLDQTNLRIEVNSDESIPVDYPPTEITKTQFYTLLSNGLEFMKQVYKEQ